MSTPACIVEGCGPVRASQEGVCSMAQKDINTLLVSIPRGGVQGRVPVVPGAVHIGTVLNQESSASQVVGPAGQVQWGVPIALWQIDARTRPGFDEGEDTVVVAPGCRDVEWREACDQAWSI